MNDEQERRAPAVDRAALAKMAPDAEKALTALRSGGKLQRRTATGKDACEITARLKVVTPILGGGPKLRDIDREDIIRVPTVRGHLRFWWRALYGHEYDSPQKLYEAESALWGRPADKDGGRSEVEICVSDVKHSVADPTDITITGAAATPGAYALWPAQSQREDRARRKPAVAPAPRYKGGLTFTLTVRGPKEHDGEAVLKNAATGAARDAGLAVSR
jgi:CRISPR-associated protein Cmr1